MKPSFWMRYKPHPLALLTACLFSLSFAPFDYPYFIVPMFAAWFAMLPRIPSTRDRVIQGLWITQIIGWLNFSWVSYAIHRFGAVPLPLTYLLQILFGFVAQPQYWLFPLLIYPWLERLGAKPEKNPTWSLARLMALAFSYAAFDVALPKLFVDTAGHSLYDQRWLRQAADLGGVCLLTTLLAWFGGVLWQWVEFWSNHRRFLMKDLPQKLMRSSSVALVMWLIWVGYGAWRSEDIRNILMKNTREVPLAIIQANIGDFDKVASERGYGNAAESIVGTYLRLSEEALKRSPRPAAIIWPETAYPSTFRAPRTFSEGQRDEDLADWVRRNKIPLWFGGYDHADEKDFNSFFMLTPPALEAQLQTYHKSILLWFGEYMPFSESIGWLKEQFPQVGNFGRGPGPQVFETAGIKISPVICYEVLFTSFVMPAARAGSQLIMNVTNDSWFGPGAEPKLHFALSVFRSIEARLPQVRATNTGISALIEADGTVVSPTPLFQEVVQSISVTIPDQPLFSLVKLWGDWFGWFAAACALVLFGLMRAKKIEP